MLSDFSVSSLIAGFVFGVIGFWLFREGKRRLNFHVLGLGLALMIYPYFVSNTWLVWIIGVLLCGLSYHLWT